MFRFCSFISLILLVPTLLLGDTNWIDFDTFSKRCSDDSRPTLFLFTDSECFGWDVIHEQEILHSKKFEHRVANQLLCVLVDYSAKWSSEEVFEEARTLSARYGVERLPTLVLLDGTHKLVKRFCFVPNDPEQFADDVFYTLAQNRDLKYLLARLDSANVEQLIKAYQLAQDLGNKKALECVLYSGIDKVTDSNFLVDLYRVALDFEKEDIALSIKERVKAQGELKCIEQIALLDYQLLVKKDPSSAQAVRPLEKFIELYGDRPEFSDYWQVEMVLAQHYLEIDQWDKAYEMAQKAIDRAPQEKVAEIQHTLDYIEGLKQLAQK